MMLGKSDGSFALDAGIIGLTELTGEVLPTPTTSYDRHAMATQGHIREQLAGQLDVGEQAAMVECLREYLVVPPSPNSTVKINVVSLPQSPLLMPLPSDAVPLQPCAAFAPRLRVPLFSGLDRERFPARYCRPRQPHHLQAHHRSAPPPLFFTIVRRAVISLPFRAVLHLKTVPVPCADRCADFGITHILFAPQNSDVSDKANNTDAWNWEQILWFGMGQRLRLGLWAPGDPLPASLTEMLEYMKAKNVKPVACGHAPRAGSFLFSLHTQSCFRRSFLSLNTSLNTGLPPAPPLATDVYPILGFLAGTVGCPPGAGRCAGGTSRRRDCHFADISSPSLLKHLLKGEEGAAE